MDNQPIVSIVTPSLNQGKFIEETILSVLNQDYPNIEYWVIDGGSIDNTIDVLTKYTNHLKWISEKDKGQANAINKGWRKCKGEILAWINSDDIYRPGAIKKAVKAFLENPETALVYGALDLISENGVFIKKAPIDEIFNEKRLLFGNAIGQPNVFIARSAIESTGFLNENYHYVFDADFWLRIIKKFPTVCYIPDVLAALRFHKECKTYKYHLKFSYEWVEIIKSFYSNEELPQVIKDLERKSIGYAYAGLAFSLCGEEKYRDALPIWFKAFSYDKSFIKNYGVRSAILWGILGNRSSKSIRNRLGKFRKTIEPEEISIRIETPDGLI